MHASLTPPDLIPLRAVSYVRVSTTRQASGGATEEGFSIPAQREANRRRAYELGALVVAEFIDRGKSGRSLERPELSRMLDYVTTTPVDFVIVHKIDRLARNRGDDATITDRIHNTGARLVSTTAAINTSPSGQLLHGIMASIAEFYSQNLANEVMKGLRQKALQGGTPGRTPLGYLNERQLVEGREIRYVALDPNRAEHITWAFKAYASGKWSLNELVTELNQRGVTTKPGPNTLEKPITLRSVHHLLRNPYYKGIVTFNGAEHQGGHEPLIDPVTWAEVQAMLAARRNGERSRVHDHYLKGSVFCIACGRRLTVQNTKSKSGRIYQYFVCTKRPSGDCPQRKSLPIPWCEAQVVSAYRSLTLTPERRQRIQEVTFASLHRMLALRVEQVDQLEREAEAIAEKQDKLISVYYENVISRELFERKQKSPRTELTQVRRKLAATITDKVEVTKSIKDSLERLQDAHTTYQAATEPIRKQLNQAVFARILLGPGEMRVEVNEPYQKLLDTHTGEVTGR